MTTSNTNPSQANKQADIAPAHAFRLAELIEHSDGSVVSRTLAKSQAGSITLFAFEAGEGLSEHSAPFDAFVQILDGEADLIIAGERVRAREGEMVRMPANVPHAVHAPGRFKMMLVMIRG